MTQSNQQSPQACPNCGKVHPPPPDFSVEAKKLIADMQRESDRGLVIVSAAFFESELESLLRKKLPAEEKSIDDLFRIGGPIDSFASKTLFAFLLGLISRNCYRDLDLMRRIRNEFAHTFTPVSFTDPAVRDRCGEFTTTRKIFEAKGPRDAFILTVMSCQIEVLMSDWHMKRMVVRER